MTRHIGAGALLLCVVALPSVARAQRLQFTVGGVGAQQIVQSHVDLVNDRFTGLLLGAEGSLVSDRFVVRLRYGEGRINPNAGSAAASRDVVEGEAFFGVKPVPWLTLWVGPSARAYTTDDGDQRWLIWTGRATARGTLLPASMQTFVELWGAFSGNVGNPPQKAGGRGAYGGLEARLGEGSWWGRLGYRMESLHGGGLRETVESVTLSLLYGLPQ